MKRIRIGNNIAITWLLFENDGNIHNLEGLDLELYMTCGGSKYPVTDYSVTENAIAWTFPAGLQTRTGYYKLVLLERDDAKGIHSFDVREAFCLEPKNALTNIGTISDTDCAITVRSVLTYAHITNIASIDVVEATDGETTNVLVSLTNGKTFTLPFRPGSGGSGGEGGGGGGSEYILPPAGPSRLGGIRVGFTKTGTKYPVLLDGSYNAYVDVPDAGGSGGSGGGGGGSTTPAQRIIIYSADYTPEYERGDGLYYFDADGLSELPVVGDRIWWFGDSHYFNAYNVVRVVTDEETGQVSIGGQLVIDELDMFFRPVDSLDSDDANLPLSANQGRILKEMIDDITGGEGGGGGTPGNPGRSITGVQNWFRLCVDEDYAAPAMNIADPSSAAGGSWSLTAGNPSIEYPYLRCFMQINYDTPLESGYTYTRSAAFTARYFNSESSQDYSDLVDSLNQLRESIQSDLAGYETDLTNLNNALEQLRGVISGSITNQLNDLRNRLTRINGTDVELILNNGLWGVLTSWSSETGDKKAFADIIANAAAAQILLQTGATFFGDTQVGGAVTLDGILGQLSAKVTRQDVNAMIASAQFSVDPSSLNSVISKSQACWKKNGVLYPYDLYLTDYMANHTNATLADYEEYMTSAPSADGPAGDSTRPAGPFELVVVVEQFSAIQQSVDEISASVDKVKYIWKKGNEFKPYDWFQTDYAGRASRYEFYTYERYVSNVLGYTKVEVGSALSNITQTEDEIKSILGDVGYFWRRLNDGSYEYQAYAVPSNQTRDDYVAAMQNAGWELVTYASRMSVIDQFPDSITALVKNSTRVWEDSSGQNVPYDNWLADYNLTDKTLSYEDYVALNHPGYNIVVVTNSLSRIKQTSDSLSTAVEDIDGLYLGLSQIEQRADQISLSVSDAKYCWQSNVDGTIVEYDYFRDEYNSRVRQIEYDAWVFSAKNYTKKSYVQQASGIKILSDKIWAAVGDGENVKASIEIIGDADTDGGKIILDASNVIINGGLSAGVVTAGAIESGAVTTDKLAANSVTAGKIESGAITADKIATGALDAIVANILRTLTVGTYSKIVLADGLIKVYDANNLIWMEIGKSSGDSTPVIKVYGRYDENNNWVPLYDLGPNGIQWASDGAVYTDAAFGERIALAKIANIGGTVGAFWAAEVIANTRDMYPFTLATRTKGGNVMYYNFNELIGEGEQGHGWQPASAVVNPSLNLTVGDYNGVLTRTNRPFVLRPTGCSAELDVWPNIPGDVLGEIADGWYMVNTEGFDVNSSFPYQD